MGLLVLLAVVSAAIAQASPLRSKAPRGNAGQPPPQGNEWLVFNGTVPPAHLAGWNQPDHQAPVPLGVTPAIAHPSQPLSSLLLGANLVKKGIAKALARRAAEHMLLGMPSDASLTSDVDYLIARKDLVMSLQLVAQGPQLDQLDHLQGAFRAEVLPIR